MIIFFSDSRLEGCWISESGNQQIKCKVVDNLLKCTWPNQLLECFQMDSGNLKGATNVDIIGFVSENDIIIWNTGNQWVRQGNEL